MSRKRTDDGPSLKDDLWPPTPLSFDDVGLPSHTTHRIQSVSYNKQARTMVAVVQPLEFVANADQRIFVRELGETRYREVALPDELASVTHALVCSGSPFVVANVMKWSTAERQAANNLGLYRVRLPSGALQRLPAPVNPITVPEQASVVALLASSPDAQELHLIVSMPIVVRLPPEVGYTMGFFLACYSSKSGHIQLIDEVPAVLA